MTRCSPSWRHGVSTRRRSALAKARLLIVAAAAFVSLLDLASAADAATLTITSTVPSYDLVRQTFTSSFSSPSVAVDQDVSFSTRQLDESVGRFGNQFPDDPNYCPSLAGHGGPSTFDPGIVTLVLGPNQTSPWNTFGSFTHAVAQGLETSETQQTVVSCTPTEVRLYDVSSTTITGHIAGGFSDPGCYELAAEPPTGTSPSISGSVATVSVGGVSCAATANTRLEVRKVLQPADDAGRFDLQVDGGTQKANAGNGDSTGPLPVSAGPHTVGEAGGTRVGGGPTDVSAYQSNIACQDRNGGGHVVGGAGPGPLKVTVSDGEDVVCTVTNAARGGKLEVRKVLQPADRVGRFDLQLDGVTKKANAGNGDTTGALTVDAGPHTVGEVAGTRVGGGQTDLPHYDSSIACQDRNGGGHVVGGSGAGPLKVPVEGGEDVVCTITNKAKCSTLAHVTFAVYGFMPPPTANGCWTFDRPGKFGGGFPASSAPEHWTWCGVLPAQDQRRYRLPGSYPYGAYPPLAPASGDWVFDDIGNAAADHAVSECAKSAARFAGLKAKATRGYVYTFFRSFVAGVPASNPVWLTATERDRLRRITPNLTFFAQLYDGPDYFCPGSVRDEPGAQFQPNCRDQSTGFYHPLLNYKLLQHMVWRSKRRNRNGRCHA